MHYGCPGPVFRQIDNIKMKEKGKKNCFMHTGTYDFGHTGITNVSDAMGNADAGIWKAMWTCCR